MLAVGVDMVEIDRLRRVLQQHGSRFANRIFTPAEQTYCRGRLINLAGRFALKEAVSKALGTGIGDVDWTDIEILNAESGKPTLILHNRAKQLAHDLGLTDWDVSLSHTHTHAIGFAVALKSMRNE